jgi:hypothetical protein
VHVVLIDIRARTRCHGFLSIHGKIMYGKYYRMRLRAIFLYVPYGLNAIHLRQLYVHEDDARLVN